MSSPFSGDDVKNEGLPLDMWREVLVRLPGECLIRIRGVCKGFRAVIDDSGFIRSHNKNWSFSSSSIFLRNYDPTTAPSCYSLDLEGLGLSNGHQAIAAMPLDLDFLSNSPPGARLPWLVAACNGLVLTQSPNPPSSLFTIWNPLTRERLELPPAAGGSYAPAFGLGYDYATDDFKAVAVLRDCQTHVYSLRSDTWRRIAADCPCGPDDGPGVFAGGLLNWLSSSSGDDDKKKIVALDLGTEKYSLLQMPPKTRMPDNESKPKWWLNVLGGCLVVSESTYYGYSDVWVLKKDSSWIKLLSVDVDDVDAAYDDDWKKLEFGCLRPVAFLMKKDERFLVFLQDTDTNFFLFDVDQNNNKSHKCVEIHERPKAVKEGRINLQPELGSRVTWDAQQMFVGTMFRLHANCGGGGVRTIAADTSNKKKRKKTSCCTKKKKKKPVLIFCVRDHHQDQVMKETKDQLTKEAKDKGEHVRLAQLALDIFNQRKKTAFVFDRVANAKFFPSHSCVTICNITFHVKNNGENGLDTFHAKVCDAVWGVRVKLWGGRSRS